MKNNTLTKTLAGIVLFLALLMVGAWAGSSVAVPDAVNCDHGECEHTHRWWWTDSHRCVPNQNLVACGTDQTGEHGCETTHCHVGDPN